MIKHFLLTSYPSTMPIDFQEEEIDKRDQIWMPAVGDAGKEIMFTFFYASRSKCPFLSVV